MQRSRRATVTPVEALTRTFNPFEYYFASGYAGSSNTGYANFCRTNMSHMPFKGTSFPTGASANSNNCYKFVFNVTETNHCGYCSDNDGTTHTSLRDNNDVVYVNIPDELTIEQCTALFQPIRNVSTCYCGAEYNVYNISSYTRV